MIIIIVNDDVIIIFFEFIIFKEYLNYVQQNSITIDSSQAKKGYEEMEKLAQVAREQAADAEDK